MTAREKTTAQRIDYSAYTRLLARAFSMLGIYYGNVKSSEFESMAIYMGKLQKTVEALQLKHVHSPSWKSTDELEIADSGFPMWMDISQLFADLSTRDERLPKFLPSQKLKEKILNILMIQEASPEKQKLNNQKLADLLWQCADRTYLEMLDLRTMFFKFTPGKVYRAPEDVPIRNKNRKAYYFSWACYDSATNLPYVYLMLFEHEMENGTLPLEEGGPELIGLLEAVEHIGERAPEELRAVGIRLDEILPNIYPIVIKRNRIGPVYSPLFSSVETNQKSFLVRMQNCFDDTHLLPEDFVLLFETEIVQSTKEKMPDSLFSLGKKKARQIFHVPKTDRELVRRGSTSMTRFALMPHRFRQHLTAEDRALFPEFSGDVQFLAYDQEERRVEHVG